jgi:hypothetical protein
MYADPFLLQLLQEVADRSRRCFVVVRAEATATDGAAMTMGIYDSKNRTSVAHRSLPVEEVADGEYRVFDPGAHDVHGGIYVWVAPP